MLRLSFMAEKAFSTKKLKKLQARAVSQKSSRDRYKRILDELLSEETDLLNVNLVDSEELFKNLGDVFEYLYSSKTNAILSAIGSEKATRGCRRRLL